MTLLPHPDVALAAILSAFVWIITNSHRQLKATCVMALMLIWYAWVPVAIQSELPSADKALWITRLTAFAVTGAIGLAACFRRFPPRLCLVQDNPTVEQAYRRSLGIATFASMLIIVAYFAQIKSLPIMAAPEDRPAAREAATTTFPLFKAAALALYFLLPLAWCGWIMLGRLALGISLFLFSVIAVAATGQKAPIAYQAFILLLLASRRFERFPYIGVTLLTIALTGTLLALVYVHNFGYTTPVAEAVDASVTGLIRRVVSVPAEVIAGWVEYFPDHHPFVGLGATEVPLNRLVYRHMNPASPFEGTANGPFFLELYARFGDYAAVTSALIATAAMGIVALDLAILARPRSTATVAAYPLFCLGAAWLAITDARSAIASLGLTILALWGVIFLIESQDRRLSVKQGRACSARSPAFCALSIAALGYLALKIAGSFVGEGLT